MIMNKNSYLKPYNCVWIISIRFDLASLFNDISTFEGYLMPKASL